MASEDEPLFLLPAGQRRSVYVCVSVDADLADRSGVMAGLMETNGLVELPRGITFARFRSWAGTPRDELLGGSVAELAAALEMGDKMGDKDTPVVAEVLAERIRDTDWNAPTANETQQLVISLPDDVLRLVFKAIANSMSLEDIMKLWPTPMQMAFFDARVSTLGCEVTLSSLPEDHMAQVLSMLSHTHPARPGLQTLSFITDALSGTTATLAAAALAHHATSLSALTLPRLSLDCTSSTGSAVTPASLHILSTLPRLSLLTALSLTSREFQNNRRDFYAFVVPKDVAAATLSALAAAIQALPALADVSLCNFTFTTPSTRSHKRRKLTTHAAEAADAAVSLDPVIAALSTVPALTSLTLATFHDTPQEKLSDLLPCSGIAGPFLSLQRLEILPQALLSDVGVNQVLSGDPGMPVAPLPSLRDLIYHCKSFRVDRDQISVFLANAARQPALLSATFRFNDKFLMHDIGDGLAQLTQLTCLCIIFQQEPPCVHRSIVTLAVRGLAKLPALQSLDLRLSGLVADVYPLPLVGEVGYGAMLCPLRALTRLQHLRFDHMGQKETNMQAVLRGLFECDLGTFSGLTSLHLHPGPMPAAELALQITRLKGLRRLHAGSQLVGDDAALRACLSPLTALTALTVWVASLGAGGITCFAECYAGMPDLKCSEVFSIDGLDAGWSAGLLALPVRPEAVYTFHWPHVIEYEGGYDDVLRQLIAMGASVPDWDRAGGTGPIRVMF